MKSIFTLLLFTGFALAAQTKVIAHKSHNGQMQSLVKNTEDNFGLSPSQFRMKVDSVERISPSTILLYKQAYREEGVLRDSIFLNTNSSNIVSVLDSLKNVYPDAKFIGFDSSVISRKKKKKSELFFLPFEEFPPVSGMTVFLSIVAAGTVALGWYLHKSQAAQLRPDVA